MPQRRETTATRRPGRPSAGRVRLDRSKILEVALAVVDAEGLGALSMRRLGSELGVDPMSLYHHVPGKAALVSGLVERVFAEMQEPTAIGAWEERVRAWAASYRRLTLSHPNLVLQIVSDPAAVSTAMLLVSEPLYRALSDAGLPPAAIVRAAGSLVDFVNGFVLAEASTPHTAGDEATILARIEAGPADRLPTLQRVYSALRDQGAVLTFDAGFDAGIDTLVAGIGALAGKARSVTSLAELGDSKKLTMRTTLALDDALLEEAQRLTGMHEKRALVREALRALIERESARRLARLGASEPALVTVPRRRPEPR